MKECKDIRVLVMDVDGTLTDGKIYIGPDGETLKAFHSKDGYGIVHLLPEMGIAPVIITGRESEILLRRCEELKISEVYQGVADKPQKLEQVLEKFGVTFCNAAYIGDDLNDLECMKRCGITACPSDAADGIKEVVTYRCIASGGNGAVREFIEYLGRLKQKQI